MKLGSLFDGSGTCPLAASAVGIIPAWASEIEPFPKAVTQSRFPKMAHLGDITIGFLSSKTRSRGNTPRFGMIMKRSNNS